MKKGAIATAVFLLCGSMLWAKSYTLKEIRSYAKQSGTIDRALKLTAQAKEAQNLSDTASDPLEISGMVLRAYPDGMRSGNEYNVGFTKNVKLPGVVDEERQMNRLRNESDLLGMRQSVIAYENGLGSLYHSYCVSREAYRSFAKGYKDFQMLFKKRQKAYRYDEISKTELLQLQLERDRLRAKLAGLKMQTDAQKESLLRLSGLERQNGAVLSCRDLYPIRVSVKTADAFSLSTEAQRKRLQSLDMKRQRYSHMLDSFDITGQYANEVDTDRYGIGVSIPLNFTSSRNEEAKAAAMYARSATEAQFEQRMRQKSAAVAGLKAKLRSEATMIQAYRANLLTYKKELLPLSRKSYELGESSVTAYLMTRQRANMLQEEMFARKQAYYQTYFKLLTLLEKKDEQ